MEQAMKDVSSFKSLDGTRPVVTHKDVRAAFKRIDEDEDGTINTEDIPAVFEGLGFPFTADILETMDLHTETTISYEDFIQKMSPILFSQIDAETVLQLNTFDLMADDTVEDDPDDGSEDPSLRGINSIINMILEQSQSALQRGLPGSPGAPTKLSDLGDLDALIGDVEIDETEETIQDELGRRDKTMELLQKSHQEETHRLLQERNALVSSLAKLDQEIGLGVNGVTVEDTLKAVVNAFHEKDLEIQRQKEMLTELIKRLRERGRFDAPGSADNKSQKEDQTLVLLTSFQQKVSYDHMLKEIGHETAKQTHSIIDVKGKERELDHNISGNATGDAEEEEEVALTPELRRAVAKLSTEYERQLNQIILSVQQDAQSRKSLADDNSWLWMQITQLKKQLEEAFDQGGKGKPKTPVMSSPTAATDGSGTGVRGAATPSSSSSSSSTAASSARSSQKTDDNCTIS